MIKKTIFLSCVFFTCMQPSGQPKNSMTRRMEAENHARKLVIVSLPNKLKLLHEVFEKNLTTPIIENGLTKLEIIQHAKNQEPAFARFVQFLLQTNTALDELLKENQAVEPFNLPDAQVTEITTSLQNYLNYIQQQSATQAQGFSHE